jgi:hypothetical protein
VRGPRLIGRLLRLRGARGRQRALQNPGRHRDSEARAQFATQADQIANEIFLVLKPEPWVIPLPLTAGAGMQPSDSLRRQAGILESAQPKK